MGATITLFQAVFDGSAVRVTWDVTNESGVLGYDLYRKTTNEPSFERLTTIPPTNQGRYQYQDTDVFRGEQAGGPFTYRLTVRTTTGDQSYTSTLSQTPSAVQRSWGSIKSMFR
jgi:hypothetical protein